MPGMLTIDAEEVRSVANGLGSIESQLKSDTEQIAWQLTTLEAALQYTDVGVSGQIRQAITQMNEVTQLLLTAQTRLLQVVSDTLQLEAVIDTGGRKGTTGDGSTSDGGGEGENKGPKMGGVAPTNKMGTEFEDGKSKSLIGVGVEGSALDVPISETNNGSFFNEAGAKFGTGAIGLGVMEKDGNLDAGIWGEVTAASVEDRGRWGSKNLGLTYGGDAKVLSASGFAGMQDDSVGAEVGVNLAEVDGHVGTDIAGVNVGVNAGVGLKLELGVEVGKHTKVKLGPFTLGLDFGGAW